MRIIPAIDIIDGKCVRLSQGNYNEKVVYNTNPLLVAQQFEQAGIKHLHLVDLDGAKAGHIVNYKVLQTIAAHTKLAIDFGGGVKSDEDLDLAFTSGATQVTAGSIAVTKPQAVAKWLNKYGAEKIIIGADVKDGYIAINGWQENSKVDLSGHLKFYRDLGAEYFICTDVSKDGMMQGPSLSLYKSVLNAFAGIKLIASGGVTTMDDVRSLEEAGLFGAIIGKAIYEGNINLTELVNN